MIATMSALVRGSYPLLLLRIQGVRSLSSHAAGGGGGGERWRGNPQQQEESKAVKVSVWWDFEMCQLPPDANPCRVVPRITAALRAAGIRGPVGITAVGDVCTIQRTVQEALTATGVVFSHAPSRKHSSERLFMADLVNWIAQNPPPAHFFLITGNKQFANILHRLRMSNYNVLLACPDTEASILCSAATVMWPWDALIKGGGFSPKHFNQPPDGLSGSWYGHYRGALDDPFLEAELKDSMNVPLHTKKPEKPPIVPKSMVDRPDYAKSVDPLPGDSQPTVVTEKSFERMSSGQSNDKVKCLIETKNEKPQSSDVPCSPSDILSSEQQKFLAVDVPSSLFEPLTRDQRKAPPVKSTRPEPPACHKEADMVIAAGTPSSGLQGSKKGLFERIQILWDGPKPTEPQVYPSHEATFSKGSDEVTSQGGHDTDQYNIHLKRVMKNYSTADTPDGKGLDNSSAVRTSLPDDPSNECSELDVKGKLANTMNRCNETFDISKAEKIHGFGESNKGIFSWAARWWSSGKSDKQDNRNHTDVIDGARIDSDKGSAFVKAAHGASVHQVGVEMFEKSYFWDGLEEYFLTPHGSELVSEAKAREELAHGLQKGCWLLRGLDEKTIHQLVHILISEKKWIKESTSETFHFQLTLPPRGKCTPFHSSKSEGMSKTISSKFPARNGKGQASYKDNENQCNDFDWEELGPISSAVDPHPEIDKVVRYQPPTPSDDEFSDDENHTDTASQQAGQDSDAGFSEEESHAESEQVGKDLDAEFSEDENQTASQQAGRDPLQSSLLKILASWNTGKDDDSRRDHAVGRLGGKLPRNTTVDCSRNGRGYRQCWRPTAKHHS
ncbi:unnamed protein product [Alopecurus aequalis]